MDVQRGRRAGKRRKRRSRRRANSSGRCGAATHRDGEPCEGDVERDEYERLLADHARWRRSAAPSSGCRLSSRGEKCNERENEAGERGEVWVVGVAVCRVGRA